MERASHKYSKDTDADARVVSIGAGAPAAATLAASVLQLQAAVLSHEKFSEAAAAFATEIAALHEFDRAAVGFCERGHTRVVATSHTADFEPDGELFRSFGAAMDEAIDQAATVVFPVAADARPLIT